MKRDWDKIRRYTQAALREQEYRSRPRRRFPKHSQPPPPTTTPTPRTKLPTVERTLSVTLPNHQTVSARFRRTSGKWRCIQADSPILWMTRIKHLRSIDSWLTITRFPFKWGPTTPPVRSGKVKRRTDESPAEAYTCVRTSLGSPSNTAPSLNTINQPSCRHPGVASVGCLPSGLPGNGVSASSPLNCSARAEDTSPKPH